MKTTANTVRITEYWPVEAEHPATHAAPIEETAHRVRGVAFAGAVPFIGLAYVIALPFIGFGALAWLALRGLARYERALRIARNVALFLAAPFVGLAYAIAFPFVGAGALVWMAIRAARNRPVAA